MDARVLKQLQKLVPTVAEYDVIIYPKSALDSSRQLEEVSHHGITRHYTKSERLFVVRRGRLSEIEIARRVETQFDYGDTREDVVPGKSLSSVLMGNEETVLILSSEFLSQPKGPHTSTKKIEVFE